MRVASEEAAIGHAALQGTNQHIGRCRLIGLLDQGLGATRRTSCIAALPRERIGQDHGDDGGSEDASGRTKRQAVAGRVCGC